MRIILLLALLSSQAYSSIKVRAREHYELHSIQEGGETSVYRGFSNTMNIWYEKPYDYSFGLAISPILGSSKAAGTDDEPYGSRLTLVNIGLEYKVFPHKLLAQTYTRFGAGYSQMLTEQGPDNSTGFNLYSALGYELPLKDFGLALELGYRYTKLSNDISINSFLPSIGLHFYKLI